MDDTEFDYLSSDMVRCDLVSFFALKRGDETLHPETGERLLVLDHGTAEMEEDGAALSGFFLRVQFIAPSERDA